MTDTDTALADSTPNALVLFALGLGLGGALVYVADGILPPALVLGGAFVAILVAEEYDHRFGDA